MKKTFILIFTTILFLSCYSLNEKETPSSISNKVIEIIQIDDAYSLNKYLAEGFPINFVDDKNNSLLFYTLHFNSLKCLNLLIERDININTPDNIGLTPIFYVRSEEALKKILEENPNLNIKTNQGELLLNYFIKNKPISYLELLVEKDPSFQYDLGTIKEIIKKQDPKLIKQFKKFGINFSLKDEMNNYQIYYLNDEKMILTLLDTDKYDIKAINKNNELIFGEIYLNAVKNGFYNLINKLLILGVDPNYTSYNINAISIARKNKDINMINFLHSKGIK